MTEGQKRAVRELQRLSAQGDGVFQLLRRPEEKDGVVLAFVQINLGQIEVSEDGLDLREVEEFLLVIHGDFPFRIPRLLVTHGRFQGFPHVVWKHTICLYQGQSEWNPTHGLYGFFDRLRIWLERAAVNNMDPFEGPLEPPHHITDFEQVPFVVRCNAPVQAGERWFGLAELKKHANRVELVGWDDLSTNRPIEIAAPTIILRDAIPMEFPVKGADFLAELGKQGEDKSAIVKYLALAALFGEEADPIHLVLGFPMRRAADGSSRIHIAVWTTDASLRKALRLVLPKAGDTDEILKIRQEVVDICSDIVATSRIKWCKVMEDRDEIVQRRERESALAWIAGKDVLILGCGALGSWAAESIARARPRSLHLVDEALVTPGILSRQNYRLQDIGAAKALALKSRVEEISSGVDVHAFHAEAHGFVLEDTNRFSRYSVVIDCTASAIFQMKLERDWQVFERGTPPTVSAGIDARAQRCIAITIPASSPSGIWSAYMEMKQRVCLAGSYPDIVEAFYSERASKDLFQPEPGCSDPTFIGSTADVTSLITQVLNVGFPALEASDTRHGFSFGLPQFGAPTKEHLFIDLPELDQHVVGGYRIRVSRKVYREMAATIRQNDRIRSKDHETGGLLWGAWDDAIRVVWIYDASGPPSDSVHSPGHFICGTAGTAEENKWRNAQSGGTVGFIGYWHTHPGMLSTQSHTDISGMAALISGIGLNQQRAIMLIQGRLGDRTTCGLYVYESQYLARGSEFISVGEVQYNLAPDLQ